MRRSCRTISVVLLSCSALFVGCFEGAGGPVAKGPASSALPVRTSSKPAAPTPAPVAEGKTKSENPPVSVTPTKSIDTKSLTDVVKEEVKGGESSGGPTPLPYLWLPSDPSLIKDEPLVIVVPLGLSENIAGVVPLSNPITKGKVELGKQLYFDPRVSKDGTISCATCHNPEKGWTDNSKGSTGIKGQLGDRSAPTVLNTVYGRSMFWDGRSPSLEGQAQGPVQNKIEMGDQTYKEIIERLRTIPGYREQFQRVFGTDVTLDGMAKAIATFERTVLSGNSAFDKYDRGDTPESLKAISDSAKRGVVLFGLRLRQDDDFKPGVAPRKANCTSCHAGANFTDEAFHNLGVGWNEKTLKFADLGRFVIAPIGAKFNSEIGAFKTPTVRDAAKTAPYMHDGSEKTLLDVVEYYDRGGNANPHLDREMKPLKLTATEKADLVEFMKALTGEEVKFVLPTLPPGADGKSPDPRAALTPPSPTKTAALDRVHGAIGR